MARGTVIFDECGFLSEEMINVYGAFAIVNKSFKSGRDSNGRIIDPIIQRSFPTDIPNQKFYISSASSTDTEFYRLYREFAKKQLVGDPNYIVLHIACDLLFAPTMHGKIAAPMLSKDTVETAMQTNPEKARREYYCEFTTDAGASAIVTRGTIVRNEELRKPLLYNDTGDKKFIISYDPARLKDNSVILVCEVYNDGDSKNPDIKMRVVNCINLLSVGKKIRSPMRTPEQIEYLKKVIIDYDGGTDNYDNILGIYIDAGSGGGGVNIADFLMNDWTDSKGVVHRGLIDKEYSSDYVRKFPNAVNKLRLIKPAQYKSEIYEAMIELIEQDKIKFTSSYDNKGYIATFDVDENELRAETNKLRAKYKDSKLSEEEIQQKINEELNNLNNVNTKIIELDWQDEIALTGIDALKEELVNMVRKPRESGRDGFELAPEKMHRMNDDRAYTMALASYGLMLERKKTLLNKGKRKKVNIAEELPIIMGKPVSAWKI